MCVTWGLGGVGLPQSLLFRPDSPWRDPFFGEAGCPWCLRNLTGWLARPRGRRQETKMTGGSLVCYHCRGRVGVAQLPPAQGGVYPALLRGALPELLSTENTDVEALSPWWVFLGLTGAGASIGESRFLSRYLFFGNLMGEVGAKLCLGTRIELSSSFGWFPAYPPSLGSQVDWTGLPGLCFTLWRMG